MATVYSTEYNNAYVAEPSVKIQPGDFNGKVHTLYSEFVLAADLGIADIVKMAKLPKGARVLSASIVTSGSLAGTCSLDLGHAANADQVADVDAFFDGLDCSSAAAIGEMKDVATHAGIFKQLTQETDLIVTAVAASSSATGESIKVSVQFVYD